MSVSELNAGVRSLLEDQFSSVWVEGEIVNFAVAASGHWYFNLNDGNAQIKCVCWKGSNSRIRFRPQNGLSVRVRGRISFYEARGETQIVVESLEPAGEGALAAAFEQIRQKLEKEGLFDIELKRPLPFFPRKVAVITSRTGAAYHDIQHVLTRRAGSVNIILVPTLVQGEGAADLIRQAVEDTNAFNRGLSDGEKVDVMIVGRGGGSAEDLWAFNDEMLARSIRASEIPVISAVGHEVDWSISDLICDLRAATPSVAAEIVAAREEDIHAALVSGEQKLRSIIGFMLLQAKSELSELTAGMHSSFVASVNVISKKYLEIASRLTPATLRTKTTSFLNRLSLLDQRASSSIARLVKFKFEQAEMQMAKLNALSPLAVLTRGFSITQTEDGSILRDATKAKEGDLLNIRLERGKIRAKVLPKVASNKS